MSEDTVCPLCGSVVRLHRDGRMDVHLDAVGRCPGSGQRP